MLEIGQTLHDRFEILRPIGEGGQGKAYLATDQVDEQEVVVKELTLGHAADWKAIELFERESKALQNLDHPAIPSYVDAFHDEEGTRFFLVQQYIDGENLGQRVEQGLILGDVEIRDFLDQMLSILQYLGQFSPPVIHRDLKPSNILVDADGTYSLIDFGAVQVVTQDEVGGSTIVGTTGYMPPEQLMGRATPATDLYALAATAVHLIAGIHPAELPMERMKLQFRDIVGFSGPIIEVLDAMLEPQVEHRLSTVAEVRGAMADPAWRPPAVAGGASSPSARAVASSAALVSTGGRGVQDIETLLERPPLTNLFSRVRFEDGALIMEASSDRVDNNVAALIAAGSGVALTILGCATGLGFLCCLSLPLLFPGVPLIAMYWDKVVGPASERLTLDSDGVRITKDNGEVHIPLSELTNCYLHVFDPSNPDRPTDMPPRMFQKPGIVFVDAKGDEHTFGTSIVNRGKLVTSGSGAGLNITELRWLYEIVETYLSGDDEGSLEPAEPAEPEVPEFQDLDVDPEASWSDESW